MADAMQEQHERHQAIIGARKKAWVVGVLGDIAVVAFSGALSAYPYTSSVCKNGEWVETNVCTKTVEGAILSAMGYKYEGTNSHFGQYASKMLGLNEGW